MIDLPPIYPYMLYPSIFIVIVLFTINMFWDDPRVCIYRDLCLFEYCKKASNVYIVHWRLTKNVSFNSKVGCVTIASCTAPLSNPHRLIATIRTKNRHMFSNAMLFLYLTETRDFRALSSEISLNCENNNVCYLLNVRVWFIQCCWDLTTHEFLACTPWQLCDTCCHGYVGLVEVRHVSTYTKKIP